MPMVETFADDAAFTLSFISRGFRQLRRRRTGLAADRVDCLARFCLLAEGQARVMIRAFRGRGGLHSDDFLLPFSPAVAHAK